MRLKRNVLLIMLLVLPGAACGQDAAAPVDDDGRVREPLTITNDAGTLDFMVELALTPQEQSLGLMHREQMAPDHGMLFVFPGVDMHYFWMRNTLLPLDIIFIRADGTIAHIAERAIPLDETSISSRVPVHSVLELNAGTADRLGFGIGDLVSHPLIDPQ